MNRCEDGHTEIHYDDEEDCPMCELLNEVTDKDLYIEDLEATIKDLNDTIKEWEDDC